MIEVPKRKMDAKLFLSLGMSELIRVMDVHKQGDWRNVHVVNRDTAHKLKTVPAAYQTNNIDVKLPPLKKLGT